MWNRSVSFPVKKAGSTDKDGFPVDEAWEYLSGIPASFTDVTRNDEMLAGQQGYTADQNVTVMVCNYSGQPFLVDEATGERYEIRRIHRKDKSMTVQLTCERRERGKSMRAPAQAGTDEKKEKDAAWRGQD